MIRAQRELRVLENVFTRMDSLDEPWRNITLHAQGFAAPDAHGNGPIVLSSVVLGTNDRETVAALLPGDTVRVTVTVERAEA